MKAARVAAEVNNSNDKFMYQIKKEFRMTQAEVDAFNALPDNSPDFKPTAAQSRLLWDLYHKYITPIDNARWQQTLLKIESAERWPSGPRMKEANARYICVNFMVMENTRDGKTRHTLSDKDAAEHFFHAFHHREASQKVVREIWERKTA